MSTVRDTLTAALRQGRSQGGDDFLPSAAAGLMREMLRARPDRHSDAGRRLDAALAQIEGATNDAT